MTNLVPGIRPRRVPVLGLLLIGALASGCGAGKGDVEGTVKFNNTPIPFGRITFQSEVGDKLVFDSPIRNGSYSIKGVPVGPVRVTVESFKQRAGPQVPKDLGIKPPGESEKAAPVKSLDNFPARYANFDESNLDYEVTGGPQTKDFNLPP